MQKANNINNNKIISRLFSTAKISTIDILIEIT